MKRKELDAMKATIAAHREKAEDIDILVEQILLLPPGQLKKIFTEDVLAVLEKYGYEVGA